MGRTLRHARARAEETTGRRTATHAGEADGCDGATESSSTDDVRGDEAESRSRDGATGSSRQEDEAPREATDEAGGIADGGNANWETDIRKDPKTVAEERGSKRARDGISHGESRQTPAEEDGFYTARDTVATGLTAARGNRSMSEAPSVASPLKPRGHDMDRQERKEQMNAGIGRTGAGRLEQVEGPSLGNASR